jgi:HD superfamily phosphohydrolase YqeK
MSAADSTETSADSSTLAAAAAGELPSWAQAGEPRRAHIRRVAELMDGWARELDLPAAERQRWLAAAWLHDALRDAPPSELRATLPPDYDAFPGPLLHGPAAAERLRGELDPELLDAIRFHTVGHPRFGALGRALYLADFLEPGRSFLAEWRASLRSRMPRDRDAVLVEVLAARLAHLIEGRRPIRPETAAFWSTLVGRDR